MNRRYLELGSVAAVAVFATLAFSGAPKLAESAVPSSAAAYIALPDVVPQLELKPMLPDQTVRRHTDGLFYVQAKANGHSIRFVVDTGATVVVLNRADAEKLGIPFESLTTHGNMRTVGGSSHMRWGKIARMDMAGKRIEKVNAAVLDAALPVSLMGQNALQQLGTVTLRGDTLTIH